MRETFHIATYGCKVNQYESQLIRESFKSAGYAESSSTEANIFIVNTCTVTAQSDSKIRQAVRRIRRLNPEGVVVITGCGADTQHDVFDGFDNIYFAQGATWQERSSELSKAIRQIMTTCEYTISSFGIGENISDFGNHTRVFVKAQDGCNSFCAYCIIPYVRGRSVSRPLEDVRKEIEQLVISGYQEIVLTGIHLGQYCDEQGNTLDSLLRALIDIPHSYRLRLSSIEPQDITDEVIDVFASSATIMPHLHLPIQHGHNDVLAAMNRKYTVEEYLQIVDSLRSRKPDLVLTTDLIVGFPGETEKQFQESLDTVLSIGFIKVHVFPFSCRPGTKANTLTCKVDAKEIKRRTAIAIDQTVSRSNEIKEAFIDRTFPVLVESRKDSLTGMWVGFTPQYIKVKFRSQKSCANKIMPVRLMTLNGDAVTGELVDADTN